MSSRSGKLGSTLMEKDEMESSTTQSLVVSSEVIVEKDKTVKASAEGPGESNKARYLERVRNLDLKYGSHGTQESNMRI